MGQTAEINISNKLVTKTINRQREYADRVFGNEIYWLKKLVPVSCFPRYRGHSDGTIYMDYCGGTLNKDNCPENWEEQCNNILAMLKKYNCRHSDIKPEELLVSLTGDITLIDFGWACPLDEDPPEDYVHLGVGSKYRPDSPRGNKYYDDKQQMDNSLFEVLGKRLS